MVSGVRCQVSGAKFRAPENEQQTEWFGVRTMHLPNIFKDLIV